MEILSGASSALVPQFAGFACFYLSGKSTSSVSSSTGPGGLLPIHRDSTMSSKIMFRSGSSTRDGYVRGDVPTANSCSRSSSAAFEKDTTAMTFVYDDDSKLSPSIPEEIELQLMNRY